MILFFAACTLFAPVADSAADPAFGGGDSAASSGNGGVVVEFVTTWVELDGESEEVPVKTPKHATFVRVDSCDGDTEGERVCDPWAGGYLLTEDDTLSLTPSAWEGNWARITWLQIGG